ncbi:MAG TPA: FkbM family methyltransferase, partial [Candidatus Omnitrophota bacterium]|nr:FkbM family methyltransferase [Candidatus Omnitrophota bacterium]
LECQGPLLPLLEGVDGIDEVVVKGEPRPEYDLCLSILSLPRFFTHDLADLSGAAYLRAPAGRGRKFAELFDTPALKIGIVWSGSVTFKGNRTRAVNLPMLLRAVDKVPGVKLYSLQKGPPEVELKRMGGHGAHITDLSPLLEDFGDTAAVLDQLDLVVMTDSSVAHLAGAMGRPVWVLLGSGSHWLWLNDRADCPWYDSVRFIRQKRPGDWPELMDRVRLELQQAAAAKLGAKLPEMPRQRPDILSQRMNAVAPSREGVLLYNRFDRYVGRSIAAYREYGLGEQALLRRFILPGDTVLDVGANIGAHTLFFARAVGPAGRVHAFEPQRVVFQSLCANMALNDITWAHCHWKAVGAAPGIASIPPVDYASTENFGGMALAAGGNGEPVEVATIDSMNLPACRMMKVDVEGMEQQVLLGAAETIRRCKPILYLENDRRQNSPELIRLITGMGYRMWWHLPRLFEPGNIAGNPFDIFGNIVSVNVLCCPPGVEPGQVVQTHHLREVTGPDDWWRSN